jgi:hypothetical protein
MRPPSFLLCLLPLLLGAGCTEPNPQSDSGVLSPDGGAGVDGPDPSFMVPVSDEALVFQFKGRINPYDAVSQREKATPGTGHFRVLKGAQEQVIDDNAMAYEYVYGSDAGELAGKRFVVVQALQPQPGFTSAAYDALFAQVFVPEGALERLGPKKSVLGVDDEIGASVRQVRVVNREDGVTLTKDCYLALLDKNNAKSGLHVGHAADAAFAVGDGLFLWGNLALQSDAQQLAAKLGAKLELHKGLYCTCVMQQQVVSCDTWEQEAQKSGTELSCPVPQDFLQPTSASYAAFTFKGPINPDNGAGSDAPGLAGFVVEVGGTSYPLDYMSSARRYTFASGAWDGKEIIELTSYGGIQTLGKDRYAMNVLLTRVTVDLLAKMKADGVYQSPSDYTLGFVAFLFAAEQVYQGQDNLSKLCPLATSDATFGSLYACHDDNQSFAAGEQLELAGNLTLSDDPQVIASWLGSADACFCSKNGAMIPCSSFPSE